MNESKRDDGIDGAQFLARIGRAELLGEEIKLPSGDTILAEDFMDVCGDHAGPLVKAFMGMSPEDERYGAARDALAKVFDGYANGDNS